MGIILNLEGPKGSGKSTLTSRLADDYGATVYHFDSDTIVQKKDLNNAKKHPVIFERGVLSFQIYDWLWDNDVSFKNNQDFSSYKVSIKRPMQKTHYDELMKHITGKFVIQYASDANILIERIKRRNAEIGKGANELEWSTLEASNEYFKAMGQFLKYLYPDKVELVDVCEYQSADDMYEHVKSLLESCNL